jgi:hypothetical protein
MNAVVIPLPRPFRPRAEIWHCPYSGGAAGEWRFAIDYIGPEGRTRVGTCADVELAFRAAMLFRNSGVRLVMLEGPPVP